MTNRLAGAALGAARATLALNFDATALVQGKKDHAMTVTFLRLYDNYERQTDGRSSR
jgi:hypothetical protein